VHGAIFGLRVDNDNSSNKTLSFCRLQNGPRKHATSPILVLFMCDPLEYISRRKETKALMKVFVTASGNCKETNTDNDEFDAKSAV